MKGKGTHETASKLLILQIVDQLRDQLINEGLLSKGQLETALNKQHQSGQHLGQILLSEGLVSEEKLLALIGRKLNLPYVDLENYLIDPKVIEKIPPELARRLNIIPLFKVEDTVTMAMADPIDVFALDEVRKVFGSDLDIVISTAEKIDKILQLHFGKEGILDEGISELEQEQEIQLTSQEENSPKVLERVAEEPATIKVVNSIIWQAVSERASDIHFDPGQDQTLLRFRIDGILHEIRSFSKNAGTPLISRLKVMTDMDISEKRIPQDGSVRLSVGEKSVDLRVASYPTVHGEAMAIRVLDSEKPFVKIEDLGLSHETQEGVLNLLKKAHGLFLVTGPTGSGKTTTLYTLVKMIDSTRKKVISIEDPVEAHLIGVNQAQVNLKAGLTFGTALRSILRLDPDVILIGEIRDSETAQLAIRAALTGHFVFSTLHTNDAVSAVTRLVNLGVEPYLVASAVMGILSQRLVRTLCSKCKTRIDSDPDVVSQMGMSDPRSQPALFVGAGCVRCKETGFYGRTGIYELMMVSRQVRQLIFQQGSEEEMKDQLKEIGKKTLRQDGMDKAALGITTVEEVFSITQDE